MLTEMIMDIELFGSYEDLCDLYAVLDDCDYGFIDYFLMVRIVYDIWRWM